jgi:hypothetical protein
LLPVPSRACVCVCVRVLYIIMSTNAKKARTTKDVGDLPGISSRSFDVRMPDESPGISSRGMHLPLQLAALIEAEAVLLQNEGHLVQPSSASMDALHVGPAEAAASVGNIGHACPKGSQSKKRHSLAHIVHASQNRFTRELCSYTRAICMRLGFSDTGSAGQQDSH